MAILISLISPALAYCLSLSLLFNIDYTIRDYREYLPSLISLIQHTLSISLD